eukprot:EG_transcript_53465
MDAARLRDARVDPTLQVPSFLQDVADLPEEDPDTNEGRPMAQPEPSDPSPTTPALPPPPAPGPVTVDTVWAQMGLRRPNRMPGVEKEEEALLNEEPEFPIPEVAEVVQTAEERQFLDS